MRSSDLMIKQQGVARRPSKGKQPHGVNNDRRSVSLQALPGGQAFQGVAGLPAPGEQTAPTSIPIREGDIMRMLPMRPPPFRFRALADRARGQSFSTEDAQR